MPGLFESIFKAFQATLDAFSNSKSGSDYTHSSSYKVEYDETTYYEETIYYENNKQVKISSTKRFSTQSRQPTVKISQVKNETPKAKPIYLKDLPERKNPNPPKAAKSRSKPSQAGYRIPNEPESFSPIFRHDPRDHQQHLPKCPHGVLLINKCGICDEEGFREETGIE